MVIPSVIPASVFLACAISVAWGAESGSSKPPIVQAQNVVLDKNTVLILVRSSLLAVSQANQTGNYTVLRDLGSAQFRAVNTAAHLGDVFKPLRDQKLDLSAAVVLEPQLTAMPEVDKAGRLHMAGFFPSIPLQVHFDLTFAIQDQLWAVDMVSVSLTTSAPNGALPQGK